MTYLLKMTKVVGTLPGRRCPERYIYMFSALPVKQGLYDPQFEHDACGVGFVVDLKGRKSHDLVQNALQVLLNLQHRGACGCEKNTGDGAGILLQMPHGFLEQDCAGLKIKLPP